MPITKLHKHRRWDACFGALVVACSTVTCAGSVKDSSDSVGGSDAGRTLPSLTPVEADEASGEPDINTEPSPDSMGTDVPSPATPPGREPPGVFPDGTPAPDAPPGSELDECDLTASESPLLKLSTFEYRNTVRDFVTQLGAATLVDGLERSLDAIPDDSRGELFSGLDKRVALEHVEGYYNVARLVAQDIVSDDELLIAVAGECAVEATLSDTCLGDVAERVGTLAYRRPVTNAERTELVELARSAGNPRQQIRALVIAAMLSPRFVHHVEVDGAWSSDASDVLQLSAYEIVSRLSYTFWQTMPDLTLFAAAADGSVLTTEGLDAALDHVLDDPRAKETIWRFWREWLALDNFTGFEFGRPGFRALIAGLDVSENLYADMVNEIRLLTEEFTFNQPATFRELLETNASVTPSTQLAALYGVEAWSGQGAYPTLDERGGLYQRAALLVSSLEQTNPFHRGAFVKRHLLCEALPSPDPAALPPGSLDIPPTNEAETTRQRYEAKVKDNDLCTGCHGLFSTVGYALESFDSLGRHRAVERVFDDASGELLAELPIDSVAEVRIGAETRTVMTPRELNQLMVDAGNVDTCFANQYFRFVNRRSATTTTSDACVAREVAAITTTLGLRAGFRRIAELTTFYRRRVGAR